MPQIEVDNLVKTFRIAERRKGMLGAVGGLLLATALQIWKFGVRHYRSTGS